MIVSKTPMRASLFGGGSDFREYFETSRMGYGSVLSTTLDMYVYIIVNKKFDDTIRVVYKGNELVTSVDEIKHNIIREALKFTGVDHGIEIIYLADIPMSNAGVGLASSSALAVGVLNALHVYKNETVSAEQLAREACHIEIEVLGQRIGIQDQFAVAIGGFNRYRFMKDGNVVVSPVCMAEKTAREFRRNFMLFFTGDTRDSSKILAEQSATIETKRFMLDDLVQTVNNVYEDLSCGNLDRIGLELDRTWHIKKKFAGGVSNEKIDVMYMTAINSGALGGKILGAGGGGFMLLYVPEQKQTAVREALSAYREIPFKIGKNGSKIVYKD